MNALLIALEWITMIISAVWLVRSVRNIAASARYIVHAVFGFIFVLPLAMDLIIGVPNYSSPNYYGFRLAGPDEYVRIVYCVFLLLGQFIILKAYAKQAQAPASTDAMPEENRFYDSGWVVLILCAAAAAAPLMVVALGAEPSILYTWGWRYGPFAPMINESPGMGTMERLTYVGTTAAILLLFNVKGKRPLLRLFSLLCLYCNICVQGKRGILFYVFLMVVVTLLGKKLARKRRLQIGLLALAACCAALIISVQLKTTLWNVNDFQSMYTTLRVDFFRDDTVKMAIYSALYPEKMKILDYPGQSVLMQAGYLLPLIFLRWIPRTGYSAYFTAALTNTTLSTLPAWRMTVSLFDSSIANFGLPGVLLGPWIAAWFARFADRQDATFKPIVLGGFILWAMFSMDFIVWYYQLWGGALIVLNLVARRRRHEIAELRVPAKGFAE